METFVAPAGLYGLTTVATFGSLATSASIGTTFALTAASLTVPSVAAMTIVSRSPDWTGNFCLRRSDACWEPFPGRVRLFT